MNSKQIAKEWLLFMGSVVILPQILIITTVVTSCLITKWAGNGGLLGAENEYFTGLFSSELLTYEDGSFITRFLV